jgi:hypothetical protein
MLTLIMCAWQPPQCEGQYTRVNTMKSHPVCTYGSGRRHQGVWCATQFLEGRLDTTMMIADILQVSHFLELDLSATDQHAVSC